MKDYSAYGAIQSGLRVWEGGTAGFVAAEGNCGARYMFISCQGNRGRDINSNECALEKRGVQPASAKKKTLSALDMKKNFFSMKKEGGARHTGKMPKPSEEDVTVHTSPDQVHQRISELRIPSEKKGAARRPGGKKGPRCQER